MLCLQLDDGLMSWETVMKEESDGSDERNTRFWSIKRSIEIRIQFQICFLTIIRSLIQLKNMSSFACKSG